MLIPSLVILCYVNLILPHGLLKRSQSTKNIRNKLDVFQMNKNVSLLRDVQRLWDDKSLRIHMQHRTDRYKQPDKLSDFAISSSFLCRTSAYIMRFIINIVRHAIYHCGFYFLWKSSKISKSSAAVMVERQVTFEFRRIWCFIICWTLKLFKRKSLNEEIDLNCKKVFI